MQSENPLQMDLDSHLKRKTERTSKKLKKSGVRRSVGSDEYAIQRGGKEGKKKGWGKMLVKAKGASTADYCWRAPYERKRGRAGGWGTMPHFSVLVLVGGGGVGGGGGGGWR